MNYIMTLLEENIQRIYKQVEILSPTEIDMYHIADGLDIWIHHHEEESKATKFKGQYYILLNDQLSPQEEWQDFAHELGHVVRHVGNQHKMNKPFRRMQESQSNNFMYHFCVPTFMLLEYEISNFENIDEGSVFVSNVFNVTEEFAKKRLIRFHNQVLLGKSDEEHRQYMDSRYPKAPPYSAETNEILDKLYRQLERKKVAF
ncbi:ImmA/IrrE family metallo-endopeptidase [Bacillus sp. JJ1773]|uniref:ImmA/IrrE family metallo-endopeptidase n=1 Tax=Bacillus sp. JJ1773 TaxID=3122965 RepID=UPI00300063F8